MDLELSEEQSMLRDMVRALCEKGCPLSTVRDLEHDEKGYSEGFWKQVADLGLAGLLIPEQYGGAGQSLIEAAIVHEEFGRALVPTPHLVSAVLGSGTILSNGSAEQKESWLPAIAGGDLVLAPAWLEPERGFGPQGVQTIGRAEGGSIAISGTKMHVPFAAAADRLLVLVRTGNQLEDIDLFLVDPRAPGIKLTQLMSLASDAQYRVDFESVLVSPTDRIGPVGSGWAAWNEVMLDAAILNAAQAAGGARKALEITAEFAKERKQFDKPLASFQALSHYLADGITAIEAGTTLTYEAAWARANQADVSELAPMAKLFMCSAFRDVTAMCQQIWGGVGFTLEYDIQLYFRRAKQLQISWWDDRHLKRVIAARILD